MAAKDWAPARIRLELPDGLTLTPSESPSRTGLHYWDLSLGSAGSRFRVWSSELPGLLDDMSEMMAWTLREAPWLPGFNPLSWRHGSTGGLILGIYRSERRTSFSIRRLVTTFTDKEGERGYSGLFRYQMWGQRRRHLTQWSVDLLKISERRVKRAVDDLRASIRDTLELTTGTSLSAHESLATIPDHILVSGHLQSTSGQVLRHLPFDLGLPSLRDFDTQYLENGLLQSALELCSVARTRAEIADYLDRIVDECALRGLIGAFARYDTQVIGLGYWASPQAAAKTYAVLDRGAFLSDPLLTSLTGMGLSPSHSDSSDWLECPQYPNSQPPPYERVITKRKGWFSGTAETALGRVPVHTSARGAQLRALATPSSQLRQKRWQILQLLQAQDSILGNRVQAENGRQGDNARVVLELQKLALLIHDALVFFPDEVRPEITVLIDEAKRGYENVISNRAELKVLAPPSSLPQARDYR